MKITKRQLKQIIMEEINKAINEVGGMGMGRDPNDPESYPPIPDAPPPKKPDISSTAPQTEYKKTLKQKLTAALNNDDQEEIKRLENFAKAFGLQDFFASTLKNADDENEHYRRIYGR